MAVVALGLSACGGPELQKTSLEIQAIQAQTFAAPKKIAFNAVMSVLQDLGFIVQSASLETGFITANSPTQRDTSGLGILSALGGVQVQGNTIVTASVEEITPKKTRIRLNYINRMMHSGQYGQNSTQDQAILDPAVYQKAFNKIGEEIFIRTSGN